MKAEWPDGSHFIRVYEDGHSYAQLSPYIFVVGAERIWDFVYLEAGIGVFNPEVWEALNELMASIGVRACGWERAKNGRLITKVFWVKTKS